jgi:ABC-type dipeptide/oligopeptide/nickel transport system ATPase component
LKELLKVDKLHVEHIKTKNQLVKGVSFSIRPGRSLIVLGQSGCGKTMTCHAMMGLLDAKRFCVSGQIVFDGKELLSMAQKERRRLYGGEIVMIPQNPMTAFNPSLKIGRQMTETLALHADDKPATRKDKIMNALERAGLMEAERVYHSYPHTLSGGMLQRVMIAMALMVNARLIVADEPTTALDVVHRNATVEAFKELRRQGAAILLVTHDFSVAAQLGGALFIMKDSEMIESGTVEDVLKNPQQPYTRALLNAHRLTKSSLATNSVCAGRIAIC